MKNLYFHFFLIKYYKHKFDYILGMHLVNKTKMINQKTISGCPLELTNRILSFDKTKEEHELDS